MEILVYVKTKTKCVQCDATLRTLDKMGLAYTVASVEEHMDEALQVVPNALTAPIVVVSGGGYDKPWGWSGFMPSFLEKLV